MLRCVFRILREWASKMIVKTGKGFQVKLERDDLDTFRLPMPLLPVIYSNISQPKISDKFPHLCPSCGSPAWISPVGARIDCSAGCK